MKLLKRDLGLLGDLKPEPVLKGACLLLPGSLYAAPELEELPKDLLAALPAIILCGSADFFIARLLNQRGVAVTAAVDPVNALPDGAEVDVDLAAGTLTETATGRRFALRPIAPAHVQEISAARGAHA